MLDPHKDLEWHHTVGEESYLTLMKHILDHGTKKEDRTGTGTLSLFGEHLCFDLRAGFPLFTTKRVHMKSIIHELIWFLRGDTNVKYLQENGVKIWDEWADEQGELGPVYGKSWRSWDVHRQVPNGAVPDGWAWIPVSRGESLAFNTIDQIKQLVEGLRKDPFSRRHIVSAWNPADLDRVALAWCHCFFQCNMRPLTIQQRAEARPGLFVSGGGEDDSLPHTILDSLGVPKFYLDLQVYIRSADYVLGTPFNVSSYALLTHVLAKCVNAVPGDLHIAYGDVHLYSNHLEQVKEQLSRVVRSAPTLTLKKARYEWPWELEYDDVTITGYDPHPPIKAPVAV